VAAPPVVFISHASADSDLATALKEELVLRILDLIHVGETCYVEWLGNELLRRWPVQGAQHSWEELFEIVHASAAQPFPSLDDAEQGLANGFLEFGDASSDGPKARG
jgi:hypothetical protein